MSFLDFLKTKKYDNVLQNLDKISNDIKNGRICYSRKNYVGYSSLVAISFLKEYMESINKPFNTYFEIGVLYGGSLITLLSSGFEGNLYGFDIFKGYYGKTDGNNDTIEKHKRLVIDNIKSFGLSCDKVTLIDGDFNDSFDESIIKIPDLNIDVLYIDGLHTESGVYSDYSSMENFLSEGSIIIFDNYDFGGVKDGVKKCLEEFNDLIVDGVWLESTLICKKK